MNGWRPTGARDRAPRRDGKLTIIGVIPLRMRRSSPASTPSPSDGFASVDPGSSLARALFQDDARLRHEKRPDPLTRPRPFMNERCYGALPTTAQ